MKNNKELMHPQTLEYARQAIMVATSDEGVTGKGQLAVFLESGLSNTTRYRRKRRTAVDNHTGELVAVEGDPVPGTQTRTKGTSKVLITPEQFSTASWRRALHKLSDQQRAWVLWCYANDLTFSHQETIVRWGWTEFSLALKGKRVAAKTKQRLRALTWLAAQDVKAEVLGRDIYQSQQLALLVGVTQDNWRQNYAAQWLEVKSLFMKLDMDTLTMVLAVR